MKLRVWELSLSDIILVRKCLQCDIFCRSLKLILALSPLTYYLIGLLG